MAPPIGGICKIAPAAVTFTKRKVTYQFEQIINLVQLVVLNISYPCDYMSIAFICYPTLLPIERENCKLIESNGMENNGTASIVCNT